MPSFGFRVVVPRTGKQVAGRVVAIQIGNVAEDQQRTAGRPFGKLGFVLVKVLLERVGSTGKERVVVDLIVLGEVRRSLELRIERAQRGMCSEPRIGLLHPRCVTCANPFRGAQHRSAKLSQDSGILQGDLQHLIHRHVTVRNVGILTQRLCGDGSTGMDRLINFRNRVLRFRRDQIDRVRAVTNRCFQSVVSRTTDDPRECGGEQQQHGRSSNRKSTRRWS